MKFFKGLRVYGDTNFRGECDYEDAELRTFFSDMRSQHPMRDILKDAVFHVENEGVRKGSKTTKSKAKGAIVKGVSDIIAVGNPMLVIELKRKDHTLCSYEPGQENFLKIAHNAGAFTCVALGYEAAFQALDDWLKLNPLNV